MQGKERHQASPSATHGKQRQKAEEKIGIHAYRRSRYAGKDVVLRIE